MRNQNYFQILHGLLCIKYGLILKSSEYWIV